MKKLDQMIITSFFLNFLISLLFFVFLIELVDLFANLWRYLNNDAAVIEILTVSLYYLPKCVMFAVSPSLLFSVAYTLGTYYSNNELIAVFGSGISLLRFTLPLLILGILFSFGSFLFNENIVIDTYKQKNNLSNTLLGYTPSFSNTNITIISDTSKIIYHADYYNDNSLTLSGLIMILRDNEGRFKERFDAEWAEFSDDKWELNRVRQFNIDPDTLDITETYHETYTRNDINEPPSTFRRQIKDINELKREAAKEWIMSIRKAGLPVYREALVDYYERYSFSLTPLIVILISSSLGGRFRKNILLMSLLTSLSISVLYYVLEMVLILLSKQGLIQPVSGAWGAFTVFTLTGIMLYRKART